MSLQTSSDQANVVALQSSLANLVALQSSLANFRKAGFLDIGAIAVLPRDRTEVLTNTLFHKLYCGFVALLCSLANVIFEFRGTANCSLANCGHQRKEKHPPRTTCWAFGKGMWPASLWVARTTQSSWGFVDKGREAHTHTHTHTHTRKEQIGRAP